MYLFVVEQWEQADRDVVMAMYAVRARSVADCVDVLFEQYARGNSQEELRAVRTWIRAKVEVSTKMRLCHRYSKSKVVGNMIYAG